MTRPLAPLTEEQTQSCRPSGEEAGFGVLHTEQGHLPLKAMQVQARIDGLYAQVKVRQTFVNSFPTPLEAAYIFPLPDRASVTKFHVAVAGRVIEGVLKERGAARRDYDQAIQAGQRAAITEEERPGVFNLRIGNLMPGEQAVVQLTLVGPLQYSDGEATFRFPLVVAPRYIPGAPLPGASVGSGVEPDTDAVPDASRITPPVLLPGFPSPVQLSLAVEVHSAGLTFGNLASSLHAVVTEAGEDGSQRIRVQPGERLDRDFILRFKVGSDRVQTALVLAPDADSRQGTFLLTLLPPTSAQQRQRPRDVVFILDRSGSMAGWKMVAARRALARMVDTLNDADRFTVYAFDNSVETPPSFAGAGLLPASDRNRFRAVEFLAGIDSRGGTELAAPLDLAANQLTGQDPARERILILVTDGQVGNEDQLLRLIGPRLQHTRIFTLGIDQAVNEGFLKRLALLGGGACELVESEDRLDDVMERVHRRIGTAVISQVAIKPSGLRFDADSLAPARLPDLFAGAPAFILGRYQRLIEDTPSVLVEGRDAAGKPWSQTIAGQSGDHPALPAIWARGRIRDLEDRYAIGSANQADLERRIVDLSLKHNVLCRFTAYVAVDGAEIVNPGGQLHQMTQPVEAPAGWAMLRGACAAAPTAYEAERKGKAGSKIMLAKQVLKEMNADGRVSKKTELAMEAFETECDVQLSPALKASAPLDPRSLTEAKDCFADRQAQDGKDKTPAPPASPANRPAQAKEKAGEQAERLKRVTRKDTDDLTAFRSRIHDLLERCRRPECSDLTTRLGVLAEQLAALIDDLRSVGIAESSYHALTQLLAEVRQSLAAQQELAQVWSRSEMVLEAFTGKKAAVREGFWK